MTLALLPMSGKAQANYAPQAGEFLIAGARIGDQVLPDASLRKSGGIIVWQDNATDGDGWGISAMRLDGSFSPYFSAFRVNQQGANDQNNPRVALLNDGGAVIVWQGGRQSYQQIYARFLSSNNIWATGDILVNTITDNSRLSPGVTALSNGTVVVTWASFNQAAANSLWDVFGQRFTADGQKLGGEFLVNQFIDNNQRTPVIAALSDGRFVVAWISEQQRLAYSTGFDNVVGDVSDQIGDASVDVYARVFNADGTPAGSEFLVNTGTNLCANPSLAAAVEGGFAIAWGQRDLSVRTNGWDIAARTFSSASNGGLEQIINSRRFGDQYAPRISALDAGYMVVWTSMGQDGSDEGVYGQFLNSNEDKAGGEILVNTTTVSRQIHPVLASDREGRCVVAWSAFVGIGNGMDLQAQRFGDGAQPLPVPEPPFVTALDQRRLLVAWPKLAGFDVANYGVYANGAATPIASVTNNMWIQANLVPASAHSFRLDYVLTDGRRSPLSASTSGSTWGYDDNFDGLPDDWQEIYFGSDPDLWPSAMADSDGDGVSNRDEFLAGTSPADANSVLRQRLVQTGQGTFLTWNAQPGSVYQVQTATAMGVWSNYGGPRFAADYLDSMYVGGGDKGYFRVARLR